MPPDGKKTAALVENLHNAGGAGLCSLACKPIPRRNRSLLFGQD
jgi:hypothetical protein